ncbi:MAG: hypothetical protein OER95_09165 [Acidimicrobiia bacterium]|nr:hypothetical protein [Acidimicrobiia bacterium]
MARRTGRLCLVAVLIGGALALAACASRPTTEQLAESIMRADAIDDAYSFTEAQAICIADELLDSGLGDATLSGLAEDLGQANVLVSDADDVEQVVADAVVACAGS